MRPAFKRTLLLGALFAAHACTNDPPASRPEAGAEAGPAETGRIDPPEANPGEAQPDVGAVEAGAPEVNPTEAGGTEVKTEVASETGQWEGGRQGCEASLEELHRMYAKLCPETITGRIGELATCDVYEPTVSFGLCDGVRTLELDYRNRHRSCNYDAAGKLAGIVVTEDVEQFCGGKAGTIAAGLGVSCHRRTLAESTPVICRHRDGGTRD